MSYGAQATTRHAPKRLWSHVPMAEWATGERAVEYFLAHDDIRGQMWAKRPDWCEERRLSTNKHLEKLLRSIALGGHCVAAVPYYDTGLWSPCRFSAEGGTPVCWAHGARNHDALAVLARMMNESPPMPRRSVTTAANAELSKSPKATVQLNIENLTVGNAGRRLRALTTAARNMGAPLDARLELDSFGEYVQAVIRWDAK